MLRMEISGSRIGNGPRIKVHEASGNAWRSAEVGCEGEVGNVELGIFAELSRYASW